MENKACFACFFREESQPVRLKSPNKKPGTRNWGQSPRIGFFISRRQRGIMSPGCIPGFLPTVAWPSEAVRVGDESITFIQKRVADPFYRPRNARRSVSVYSVCSVVKRPEAPRDKVPESLPCSRQRLRTQRQVCCTIP